MKFFLDSSGKTTAAKKLQFPKLILGQLITPLTKYRLSDDVWAMDNGAFGDFKKVSYERLIKRHIDSRDTCKFITVPDVVGSARRTLELFDYWKPRLEGWPVAFVLQDGIEDLPIPWELCDSIFVGGTTAFKESNSAVCCVKAALAMNKHVHIGRVNTVRRYRKFSHLGAHTCDGTGVVKYDWMLQKISDGETDDNQVLFDRNSISSNTSSHA